MIIGDRLLPKSIASHSSVKQVRPCSIRAGDGRRARLSKFSILRIGRGRGQCQCKRDRWFRHDGLLLLRVRLILRVRLTRGDTTRFRSTVGEDLGSRMAVIWKARHARLSAYIRYTMADCEMQ